VTGWELSLWNRESFRQGIEYGMGEMETEVLRYERRIKELEDHHEHYRRTIRDIMASRTFRVGMAFNRIKSLLKRSS
jgi:hypothetical protein